MDKKLVYLFLTIGGLVGSYLPVILFHASSFGAFSILGGAVGSIMGIIAAYKLNNY